MSVRRFRSQRLNSNSDLKIKIITREQLRAKAFPDQTHKTNQFIFGFVRKRSENKLILYLVLFNLCSFICSVRCAALRWKKENGEKKNLKYERYDTVCVCVCVSPVHRAIQSQFILKCYKHSFHIHIHIYIGMSCQPQQSISAVDRYVHFQYAYRSDTRPNA